MGKHILCKIRGFFLKIFLKLQDGKAAPGYEVEYCMEARRLPVYHYGSSKAKGYLSGRSPKEVIGFYRTIKPCTCGGVPKVIETECMGDFDMSITCMKCGRRIYRNMYDPDVIDEFSATKKGLLWEEIAVRNWNNGLTEEDVNRKMEETHAE